MLRAQGIAGQPMMTSSAMWTCPLPYWRWAIAVIHSSAPLACRLPDSCSRRERNRCSHLCRSVRPTRPWSTTGISVCKRRLTFLSDFAAIDALSDRTSCGRFQSLIFIPLSASPPVSSALARPADLVDCDGGCDNGVALCRPAVLVLDDLAWHHHT